MLTLHGAMGENALYLKTTTVVGGYKHLVDYLDHQL